MLTTQTPVPEPVTLSHFSTWLEFRWVLVNLYTSQLSFHNSARSGPKRMQLRCFHIIDSQHLQQLPTMFGLAMKWDYMRKHREYLPYRSVSWSRQFEIVSAWDRFICATPRLLGLHLLFLYILSPIFSMAFPLRFHPSPVSAEITYINPGTSRDRQKIKYQIITGEIVSQPRMKF
ncbi:hypothetical protein BDD12DRAFT_278339 [Trichophaea hybrida]|nr:hypothetical protein BDD12DRAFT_278339 [Trichophaea hybrida]